jgi:hypothetical protein
LRQVPFLSRVLAYKLAYADLPQANRQGIFAGVASEEIPELLELPLTTFFVDPDFHSFRLVRVQTFIEIEAQEQDDEDCEEGI